MTISLQSTITKPSPCKDQKGQVDNGKLKALFEDILKRKNEYDKAEIHWIDDETVEVKGVSNLCLQSFLLEAEQHGKDIAYTKQTIIKIA
jgi:hypothetical protein